MKKWIAALCALMIVLVAAKVFFSVGNGESDKSQIQKALADSIQASREGRPGGVMGLLSDQLTVNQQEASGSLGQVAKFIKDSKPDITVENNDPIVTGDEARITSPVDLTFSLLGSQKSVRLKNVVLVFRKEDARDWVVIPTKRWRLVEVRAPEAPNLDLVQ